MAVTEVIGTSIELTCSTSPQDPYLDSLTLTYTWLKDGSATGLPTTATFTPTESGTYSCTAQLSSLTKLTSVTVKVTIDNFLLETSSSMPIKGGRVILTCGEKRTDGTTYTWTKDAKPIARQFDRRLQLDNFDTTDDGIYACQASGNQFYLRSNTINLETQTSIFKPSIEQIGSILCSESFFEKGDYWLVCDTSSETIGMTYEWTV
ncbi:hemicentin-2 [Biomphalaria glabrata]